MLSNDWQLAPHIAFRQLAREWRAGELLVLASALIIAVAAVTAVSFFTDRVMRTVERQAAEILAADLVIRSGRPIDPGFARSALDAGVRVANKTSFPSVVLAGEASSLADIDAVTDGYPLRGELRIADAPFAPARPTRELPGPGQAWADSRLLARLGIGTGEGISVGAVDLLVTQVLDFAPDRGWDFADLAPALLINDADLAASKLIMPGSRVTHQMLFSGSHEQITRLKQQLTERLEPGVRLRDLDTARPEIRASVTRAGQFLSLAALTAALLASVAVAMSARSYAVRRLDAVALMKALGASQRLVTLVVIIQLGILAGLAGVIGSVLGFTGQTLLTGLLGGLLGAELPAPGLRPALAGVALALVLTAGFALPASLALRTVPPARVLRADMGQMQARQLLVYLAASAAALLLLAWLTQDLRLFTVVLAGAGLTLAILLVAGWILVRLVQPLRSAVGVAWRYGLANIARRGSASVLQLSAFGLGLMILLLLGFVRGELLDSWQASLPEDAPNQFLINIQPDEAQAVSDFLIQQTGVKPNLMPMIRARIASINQVPVTEIQFANGAGRRWTSRESNLSWADTLPPSNELLEGQWYEDGRAQVSLERDFAQDLGVSVGDTLGFDIAGEALSVTVTSIRRVQWESLQPNFFMLFGPGVLEPYPATWIGSFRLPPEKNAALTGLLRQFPSVSPLDMNALFRQVRGVMDQASMAVQYVFAFTLLAGVVVLGAAVQATHDERSFESAMLRTLGASRAVIRRGLLAEYGMLGLMAGLMGALGASVIGALLARQVFELNVGFSPALWLTGLAAGAVIVGGSGLLATRRVVNQPPTRTLHR